MKCEISGGELEPSDDQRNQNVYKTTKNYNSFTFGMIEKLQTTLKGVHSVECSIWEVFSLGILFTENKFALLLGKRMWGRCQ